MNLIKGLRFYGSYNFETENANIGVRLDLPNMGYIAELPVDKDGNKQTALFGIHNSTRRFSSIFPGGPKRTLSLKLSGSIVEQKRGGLFSGKQTTMVELLESIKIAKKSNEIKSIEIIWDSPSIGFSSAIELRKALVSSNKPIRFYARSLDNTGYYVASCSDEIVMAPEGYLFLVGLSAEVMYYKGTLDKLGIKFDVVHAGKYKDPGIFTSESMPEPVREEYDSLFNIMYDTFVKAIAQRTGDDEEKAKSIINAGPYTSSQAVEAGLVDTLMFKNDFSKYVKGIKIRGNSIESFKDRNEDFAGGKTIEHN